MNGWILVRNLSSLTLLRQLDLGLSFFFFFFFGILFLSPFSSYLAGFLLILSIYLFVAGEITSLNFDPSSLLANDKDIKIILTVHKSLINNADITFNTA